MVIAFIFQVKCGLVSLNSGHKVNGRDVFNTKPFKILETQFSLTCIISFCVISDPPSYNGKLSFLPKILFSLAYA